MSVPSSNMQTMLPTGKMAAEVWADINQSIRKRNYKQAVSYLRAEILNSKVYEEHARLDREREANFQNLQDNSAEHTELSEKNLKTRGAYEGLALALGKYLTTHAPDQAIAAYQLIQNVSHYIKGLPEEVFPLNANYSKAQTAIVDIYSSYLQKSLTEETRHQYLTEIFRAAYNVRIGLKDNDLNYYNALGAFLGSEVLIPPYNDFDKSESVLDKQMNLVFCKIYLSIMDQIRKSMDPSSKETSEQAITNKMQALVTLVADADTSLSYHQNKVALLSLLEGYMDPQGMVQPKLFSNFDHAGVKKREGFLLLELPLYLGNILWGLQQKKNLVSKASANPGTVNNSTASMAASASQSNGSAILSVYKASTTTSATTVAAATAATSSLPQPEAGATAKLASNNSAK